MLPQKIKILLYLPLALLFIANIFILPCIVQPAQAVNDTMPKLQIPIPNVKFSVPTDCGTDNSGNNLSCVAWIGEYIAGIYQYAIGIVGILAAVVLMIGGVMWIVAGGSATMIGEAKAWIGASLTGLVIALCSYLILYTVNPALTIFNPLKIAQVEKIETASASGCSYHPYVAGAEGTEGQECITGYTKSTNPDTDCQGQTKTNATDTCCCPTITAGTGGCIASNFTGTCFASDSTKASCICQKESSGNAAISSGTDLCVDGTSWSIGLWQINIIDSAGGISQCNGRGGIQVGGNTPLPQAGSLTCLDSNNTIGCCLERKTGSNGINYCSKRNCALQDSTTYNACTSYLKIAANNIAAACQLYTARGWAPWSNSASLCGGQ